MYMVSFSFSIKFISFFNRWFLYNVFLYGCLEYKLLYAWMSGMNNCIEIYYSICYNFIIFFCSSVLLDLKDFFNVLHQQPSSKALLYMYLVQGQTTHQHQQGIGSLQHSPTQSLVITRFQGLSSNIQPINSSLCITGDDVSDQQKTVYQQGLVGTRQRRPPNSGFSTLFRRPEQITVNIKMNI